MRILHTADWHLGDRLGNQDRTHDLRKSVERIGKYCIDEKVDVLLVAGDLFSDRARADSLRETIAHWRKVFQGFLAGGGTIVTLTGNHDNEDFCATLGHAMNLAAPTVGGVGETYPNGRFHLATKPTLFRLKDREGAEVQFLMMPYPATAAYLDDPPKFASPEEKHARLTEAFLARLRELQANSRYDAKLPSVLGAHINVRGTVVGAGLFRLTEAEDVLIDAANLADEFAYVALGHIHKPQALGGRANMRYAGSIERLDLGERDDDKSVVLLEIGRKGVVGEPRILPLESTQIHSITVNDPGVDLPELRKKFAGRTEDLIDLHLRYTPGVDDLENLLEELRSLFPRYYQRHWEATNELGQPVTVEEELRHLSFNETVREYVTAELQSHSDEERADILRLLEDLLEVTPT